MKSHEESAAHTRAGLITKHQQQQQQQQKQQQQRVK